METIRLHSHVGSDGMLRVEVPVATRNSDLDVVLVVQPAAPHSVQNWPEGFFEETFGAFRERPLERSPQGDYEARSRMK
jgi:hypothetical protein